MYSENLVLITYNGWYAIRPNQTKSYIFNIYVYWGFGIKKTYDGWYAIKPDKSKFIYI